MDPQGLKDHPDLGQLAEPRWFALRARWRARRTRARMKKMWRSPDVQRRQRRKTLLRLSAVVLTPIAVVGVVAYLDHVKDDQPSADLMRTPPPTTSTVPVPNGVVELHQPFANTPASSWDDGIEGITFPEPEAIGEFSADEVADALEQAKRNIVAAYLDRHVIEEHDLEPFLDTLAPDTRDELRAEMEQQPVLHLWPVLIDPDHPLLPAIPKTSGTVSVQEGRRGELLIDARFAVAYAFDTDDPDRLWGPMDIVSVVQVEQEFHVLTGPGWLPDSRGLRNGTGDGFAYSLSCTAAERGYLAPLYSERRFDGEEPEHDDEYYFDPEAPVSVEDGCNF